MLYRIDAQGLSPEEVSEVLKVYSEQFSYLVITPRWLGLTSITYLFTEFKKYPEVIPTEFGYFFVKCHKIRNGYSLKIWRK